MSSGGFGITHYQNTTNYMKSTKYKQQTNPPLLIASVIARYFLLTILAIPFLLLGLLFDLFKLPVILFFIIPIWFIMDLAEYLRTGHFSNTISEIGEVWYLGTGMFIDMFYGTHFC